MQIDFNLIKNKQRIFIGGDDGTKEILQIVKHSLNFLNKPFDLLENGEKQISDAPIFLFTDHHEMNPATGQAYFHEIKPHIALFHKIQEPIPADYGSFESFINQFEILAENLPKAGTLIYYQSDNVSMIIGKKERQDVRNIEYSKIKNEKKADEITFKFDTGNVSIPSTNASLVGKVSAAFTLLKQLGIKESEFINSLKTLKISV